MTDLEEYKHEVHDKKMAAWNGVSEGTIDRATATAIDNEYREILNAIRNGARTMEEFNAMKNGSAESQESSETSETASLKVIDKNAAKLLTENGEKTKIILPDSVCKIEEEAFSEFSKLESVDMSNCINLTEIGKEAFSNCTNLERVVFPPNLENLGDNCFRDCEKLESIDLSSCDGLKKLPQDIFTGCTSLEEIEWPANLEEIEACAFCGCESLRRIDLPDSVERLGEDIFAGVAKMKSISLPASLKKLPSLMGWNGAVKSLDMSRCKKLRVITEDLKCTGKSISFPMGVEEIEATAFVHSNFKSIYLPPTVTEVELDPIYTGDTAVYCYAPELDTLENLLDRCDCLYVLPQYIDNYTELAEAEEVEGNIDVIPDDKIYFYEE